MKLDLPERMLKSAQAAYEVPPRAYHTWAHVEEVVRWNGEGARVPGWKQPREILLATVYHDAIYVPGAKDNKARSAELALAQIREHLHHEALDVARVAQLINLTARHGSLTPDEVDAEAALFLDCDMAILGAEPDAFDRYDRAIRTEYATVPRPLYELGRKRFLRKVLESPRIFLSPYFHDRLDAAARANLRRALSLDG